MSKPKIWTPEEAYADYGTEHRTPARRTDPATSHEAASVDRSEQKRQIEAIFERHYPDGLTNYDLMLELGLNQMGDFSSRVSDLWRDGTIRRIGKRKPAADRSAQNVHVWVPLLERI